MKSHFNKVLTLFICIIFLFSCSYKTSIRPEELKTNHNVMVIPFKTPPVLLESCGLGTALLFGAVGVIAVNAATSDARANTAEMLDRIRGEWDPTNVTSHECLNLLKNSSVIRLENVVITEVHNLCTEYIEKKEPKYFTEKTGIYFDWFNCAFKWLKNDIPAIQYRIEYLEMKCDWALEVTSTSIIIRKGTTLDFSVIVKLFNTRSGEKIVIGYAHDTFDISEIKEASDFKLFEEQFRNATKQLCGKTLTEMGLISPN